MYRACEYVFLTPSALGTRRYRRVCEEFRLEPLPCGYGALLCRDSDGHEVTKLTTDPAYLRAAIAAISDLHRLLADQDGQPVQNVTELDGSKFTITRAGWPTQHCRAGV
jgi:hypothetical protein